MSAIRTRPSLTSPSSLLKVGIVAAGYIGAFLVASAVVAIRLANTRGADAQAEHVARDRLAARGRQLLEKFGWPAGYRRQRLRVGLGRDIWGVHDQFLGVRALALDSFF